MMTEHDHRVCSVIAAILGFLALYVSLFPIEDHHSCEPDAVLYLGRC